ARQPESHHAHRPIAPPPRKTHARVQITPGPPRKSHAAAVGAKENIGKNLEFARWRADNLLSRLMSFSRNKLRKIPPSGLFLSPLRNDPRTTTSGDTIACHRRAVLGLGRRVSKCH